MEEANDSVHNSKNAFLAVYLIIAIILTLAENITLLRAVCKTTDRNSYLSLAQICALEICAAVVVLPCTLLAVADKSYILEKHGGQQLCQFFGSISAFLYRSSTYTFCLTYIDR